MQIEAVPLETLGAKTTILIFGTSNSVMKGGWTYGLRAALPAAKIDTFTVGGSPCVQFSAEMRRDFSQYDFVFFDSVPNDEQYIAEGGNRTYLERIFFEMASSIQAKSQLVALGLPREENLAQASAVYLGRHQAAAACGAQFLDMRDFVKTYGDCLLESDERLYEDAPHPNRKLSALFGFQVGQSLLTFQQDRANRAVAEDFSTRFRKVHAAEINRAAPLVAKNNSLLSLVLAEISAGDVIDLKGLGKSTGVFLDKSDTKCRVSIKTSSGKTLSWKLLFKDKPNVFSYYFQPLEENLEIQSLAILPRQEFEPGFPPEYNSLPNRALISDIAFWDGDATQNVPEVDDLSPSLALHRNVLRRVDAELPAWREALKLMRSGVSRNLADDVRGARSFFDAADEKIPVAGEQLAEISKIFRRLDYMPKLSANASAMPLRTKNFSAGLQMASSCGLTAGGPSPADVGSFNQRIAMTASLSANWRDIVICLANFDGSTTAPGPNALTWRCSLEYPEGVILPFVWDDSSDVVTLQPGDIARSKPIAVTIPAGSRFWFRSHVKAPPGGHWFASRAILQPEAGSGLEQPANEDKSMSGEITPSYGYGAPVPAAMTGRPDNPLILEGRLSSLAIWGDSILEGRNDTARRGQNSALGWAARAATLLEIGYTQVSKAGTSAYQQMSHKYFSHKAQLIDGCSHVVTNFGTNDIGQRRRPASLLIEDVSRFAEQLQDCGHSVILSTLLPRWNAESNALIKGDTDQTIEEIAKYNAWVRTDPFGSGIFDAAAEACDPVDPTRWRLDLGPPAQDGLHPNAGIHSYLALAFARKFALNVNSSGPGRTLEAGAV